MNDTTFTTSDVREFLLALFLRCGREELCKTNIEAIANHWAEKIEEPGNAKLKELAKIAQYAYHQLADSSLDCPETAVETRRDDSFGDDNAELTEHEMAMYCGFNSVADYRAATEHAYDKAAK